MVGNSQGTQRGHSLEIMLLVVAWLAGIAAGGYLLAVRLVPAVEQHIASAVESTLLPQTSYRVGVSVAGYETTLSGKVSDADERQRLLRAAGSVPGVRHVVDRLQIATDPRLLDFPLGVLPPRPRSNDKTLTPEVPSDNKPRTRVLGAISTPWRAPDVWKSSTSSGIELATAADVLADAAGETVPADLAATAVEADIKGAAAAQVEGGSDREAVAEDGGGSDREAVAEDGSSSDGEAPARIESSSEGDTVSGIETAGDGEAAARTQAEAQTGTAGAATELDAADVAVVADDADDADDADVIDENSAMDAPATRRASEIDTVAELPVDAPAPSAQDTAQRNDIGNTAAENTANRAESDAVMALRRDFDALDNTLIEFQTDSDVPTAESLDVLDTIARLLLDHPKVFVNIGGHTDSAGEVFDNLFLSQNRSNAVRDYLTDRGVSPYRLLASGYGEGLPIASNETAQGRAANRRIEFEFSEDSTL